VSRTRRAYVRTAVAGLALAGLLAGCGAVATPSAPPDVPQVDVDAPPGNPGTAVVALPAGGLDAALAWLPDYAETLRVTTGVPGMAIAVVHGGQTVWSGGFGDKVAGTDDPVDPQTVFQLASVSKPIGATVVATQVTKKVVAWDTPLRSELEGFRLKDRWVSDHVTVGDAYSHRTGLPHAAGDLLEDVGYSRSYVLEHLRKEPLSPFRSTYDYANFGLTAGAEAVAHAAGTDWATLSEEELYRPLGMTSTSSRYADFLARSNRATLNVLQGGQWQALYQRDADPQSPAGGVSSNVVDLAAWMRMVLARGEVGGEPLIAPEALAPATRAEMLMPGGNDVTARPSAYGYGFNVGVQPGGRVSLTHSGGFALGAGTAMTMIPSADLGVVVLTNGSPVGLAEAINAAFVDEVQFGHVTRDWLAAYTAALAPVTAPAGDLVGEEPPADADPAGRLSRYTGTYTNSYYGKAVVRKVDGHLEVAMGRKGGYRFALDPWDGRTFSFVPTGENAPEGSLSSARFTVKKGKATRLRMEFFDATGLGTWKRR